MINPFPAKSLNNSYTIIFAMYLQIFFKIDPNLQIHNDHINLLYAEKNM